MPPSSAPVNSGVVASLNGFGSPAAAPVGAKTLGAFDAPQATTPLNSVSGTSPLAPKPSTEHLSLNVGTGSTTPTDKQVTIPKMEWTKPVTVAQATNSTSKLPGFKAVATFVGDGDGAILKKGDGSSIECRIDSIDAPEVAHPKYSNKPAQAFGEASKKTLQDLILNKEVTVRVSKPASEGKFNRSYCQIEIEGEGVDKKMLQTGMAWLLKTYSTPELAAAQAEAKSNKRGLWSDPAPIHPAAFRYGK